MPSMLSSNNPLLANPAVREALDRQGWQPMAIDANTGEIDAERSPGDTLNLQKMPEGVAATLTLVGEAPVSHVGISALDVLDWVSETATALRPVEFTRTHSPTAGLTSMAARVDGVSHLFQVSLDDEGGVLEIYAPESRLSTLVEALGTKARRGEFVLDESQVGQQLKAALDAPSRARTALGR